MFKKIFYCFIVISMFFYLNSTLCHATEETSAHDYLYYTTNQTYEHQLEMLKYLGIVTDGDYVPNGSETFITRREAFTFACKARGGIGPYSTKDIIKYTVPFLSTRFYDMNDISDTDDYMLLFQCTEYNLIKGRKNLEGIEEKDAVFELGYADLDKILTVDEMETLFLRIKHTPEYIIDLRHVNNSSLYDMTPVKKHVFFQKLYEIIHEPYFYDEVSAEQGYIVDDLVAYLYNDSKLDTINKDFNITSEEAESIAKILLASRYKGIYETEVTICYCPNAVYSVKATAKSNLEEPECIDIYIVPQNGQIIEIKEYVK